LNRPGPRGGQLKNSGEHLAGAADLHLVLPILVNAAVANRTIDKPAQVPALEFPGGTLLFLSGRTAFYAPTRLAGSAVVIDPRHQKIHLALHSRRYGAPALFIAVNCLQGSSEQLSHLLLSFTHLRPIRFEFVFVHAGILIKNRNYAKLFFEKWILPLCGKAVNKKMFCRFQGSEVSGSRLMI